MLTSRGLVALLALGHGFGFSPAQRTLRPRDRASLRAEPESAPENFFVGADALDDGDALAVESVDMGALFDNDDWRDLALTEAPWGGSHADEASFAATLVQSAVRVCIRVAGEMAFEDALASAAAAAALREQGKTVGAEAAVAGVSVVKGDATPVTAADFAIQGAVSRALSLAFPRDRFMGEEDAAALREDPALRAKSLAIAREITRALAPFARMLGRDGEAAAAALDAELGEAEFLAAVDRGAGGAAPGGDAGGARVWILDPIDGTKGLITGRQYIVGLALVADGAPVVAAMGNPARSAVEPCVMVAAKGHGLRYWPKSGPGPLPLDRAPTGDWHEQRYDHSKFVPALFGIGSDARVAGVDYPPWYMSPTPRPDKAADPSTPRPFGPSAPPGQLCCGSMVKYYAVAQGRAAGFIQFESRLKSWDHAAGVLCVEESGGLVVDAAGQPVRFYDREFQVEKGIVCSAAEADEKTRQRLLASVAECDDECYATFGDGSEEQ